MYDVFKRICDAEILTHTYTHTHVLRPHFHITVIQTHSIDSICIGQSVVCFSYVFLCEIAGVCGYFTVFTCD